MQQADKRQSFETRTLVTVNNNQPSREPVKPLWGEIIFQHAALQQTPTAQDKLLETKSGYKHRSINGHSQDHQSSMSSSEVQVVMLCLRFASPTLLPQAVQSLCTTAPYCGAMAVRPEGQWWGRGRKRTGVHFSPHCWNNRCRHQLRAHAAPLWKQTLGETSSPFTVLAGPTESN